MSSNLPPGCSENDIPGNRPGDCEYENALNDAVDSFVETDLTAAEIKRAVIIGIAAIKADRESANEAAKIAYETGYENGVLDMTEEGA